ncbi:dihydrofolate reductase family protein [Microbacterium flavescens]|uniref:dihydrofolate reductase family protein n=1 Tax=Microbacterium flavescens TaxID=69366 RepID=UPI001BDE90DA|nr:dihydrofolate reductase family protein [Microbacterium flavescens]BFF08729.1 dihydrofolate reductase family protein [Microbacterium flavescens]BFF12502.1 dihydrofolate reductase family protein [Microbacterium flavescens]
MSTVIGTMSLSLDGIGAGRNQTEERPFGDVPEKALHRWMFETPEESRAEIDDIVSAGAYVMGRNMFGPVRGEWDRDWRGWWGSNPPYHTPVFVLTHHPHHSIEMEGGTTFHFVTDGIEKALDRARDAAGDRTVHIAGGVSTLNQYLRAGLVDELMLQISPSILGEGLRPLEGLSGIALEQISARPVSLATHVRYRVLRTGIGG